MNMKLQVELQQLIRLWSMYAFSEIKLLTKFIILFDMYM